MLVICSFVWIIMFQSNHIFSIEIEVHRRWKRNGSRYVISLYSFARRRVVFLLYT